MPQTSPLNWLGLTLSPLFFSWLILSFKSTLKKPMMKKNISISQNIWKW